MPEEVALQQELPTREIWMDITGIGGHSLPVVGLAEGISFNIDTKDRKAANFFIVCGKVYTVLGQPFLADHKDCCQQSRTPLSCAELRRTLLLHNPIKPHVQELKFVFVKALT
ncbi:hypothetical protein VP01_891g10 [Puccinia sorghi]|uniref:Uncharacterized protein n=1 Tax=Puccinia sorghi TaxID=27349 RepID=A0A0L6U854_9BASI|nr:hypothetical protein VP01_891g10 [Puccinia sorghi]